MRSTSTGRSKTLSSSFLHHFFLFFHIPISCAFMPSLLMVSKQFSVVDEEWGKLHLWSWCKVSELYIWLLLLHVRRIQQIIDNWRVRATKLIITISYHIVWYNTRNNNGYVKDIWNIYRWGFSDNINVWYIGDIENKVWG